MKSLNVNIENLTEDERNQLLELIKKANGINHVWRPKLGENYWYINERYDVYCVRNNGTTFDKKSLRHGNCFKTKEEAEFVSEKKRVKEELELYAKYHNDKIDWKDRDQVKAQLYYNYDSNNICIEHSFVLREESATYFSSERIAKNAIKEIGEDRIKKYLFDVK